jgi:large subunit ribosomal protein L6
MEGTTVMSRIGKKPVTIPSGLTATISGQMVKMKGPKGELSFSAPEQIKVAQTAAGIEVSPKDETKMAQAMWGMSRTQIQNLIDGVTKGYEHVLEIHGVGFKAEMKGKDKLIMKVGFSHDIEHAIPAGVEVKVSGPKQDIITVTGIDKQKTGQVAAEIRAYRPPEPYQGKGVRYKGEFIRRKEGKTK